MHLHDKLNAIGDHYGIAGWRILTRDEKMTAIKDRTGKATIDAAYEHMLAAKEKEKGKSGGRSVEALTTTQKATLASALAQGVTRTPPPLPPQQAHISGTPITVQVQPPVVQIASQAPVIIEPRREPPQWWELAGRFAYWSQVYGLGLLTGVLVGPKMLALFRVVGG